MPSYTNPESIDSSIREELDIELLGDMNAPFALIVSSEHKNIASTILELFPAERAMAILSVTDIGDQNSYYPLNKILRQFKYCAVLELGSSSTLNKRISHGSQLGTLEVIRVSIRAKDLPNIVVNEILSRYTYLPPLDDRV